MKLLLSGGGGPEQVVELDKYFADYVKDGKVLYIPVAMDKVPYDDCFNWFKNTYKQYGITNIDTLMDLSEDINLNEYKAIFIGGGNTFKLLKEIKDNSFDKKIIDYLKNGGFIYGGSAGAIIFGLNISTAIHADKNYVNLDDLSGLNLLNNANVWCHYDKNKDFDLINNLNTKTYLLFEESGLIIENGQIEFIGKESEIILKETDLLL